MAKKYAFLFPGQGAQEPDARRVLDSVSSITGKDMTKLLWETEQAELSRSDNSQLAITTASLVIAEVLRTKGIVPSAAMGFSLGEFPALCIAGVLSFDDVIRVVQKRGQIMQMVCEEIAAVNAGHAPGMSAIIGLPPGKVQEICNGLKDVYAANLNSFRQTVISGTADGLAAAEKAATEAGARRAIRLSVAGPFHCPLMQKAADEFEKVLADVTFNDPKIDLFSNVTGKKVTKGVDAKKNAVLHLTHPVQWMSEEKVLGEIMTADTADEWMVLEPGVGKVLSGLWRDSGFGEKWESMPINSAESINGVL